MHFGISQKPENYAPNSCNMWEVFCLALQNEGVVIFAELCSKRFCYNMVKYKLFSTCERRNVALVFKEGMCILEKRVGIIGAKIIELLLREFTAGKFLDGSIGKNWVEGGALMLSISDVATERRGSFVYLPSKKSLKLKGVTRKNLWNLSTLRKSVYCKSVKRYHPFQFTRRRWRPGMTVTCNLHREMISDSPGLLNFADQDTSS